MTPAGYSGTPLAKKLGITANTRVLLKHAPSEYDALVAPLPIGVVFDRRLTAGTDIVHLFVDRAAVMAKELQAMVLHQVVQVALPIIKTGAVPTVDAISKSVAVAQDCTECEVSMTNLVIIANCQTVAIGVERGFQCAP